MDNRLHIYLEKWALSAPKPLTETFTSRLYEVTYGGEPAILKLLKPVGIKDEQGGAAALRHFNG